MYKHHPFLLCVLSLLALLSHGQSKAAKRLIYQYDPITWVENLAVRPNGRLLPITTTSPLLDELNLTTGTLQLVHDFSSYGNAIQSITEVTPDIFALNVLTCTIPQNLSCMPGTVSTWTVDYCERKRPKIRLVAKFPDAGFLNGMVALDRNIVLMADSFLGGIWSLNIHTGQKKFLFSDPSMNGTATIATGINGIRVRPGMLYYTNSAIGSLNRIPVNPKTGMKTGAAKTIATGLTGLDDFEIDDETQSAYVCNGAADEILKILLDSGKNQSIAKIPGPTSARWNVGQIGKTLYVSDVGGLAQYVEQNVTLGGAIYRLKI